MTDILKTETTLPQSLEAEQALLGAILADENSLVKSLEILPVPEMFYKKTHQTIYQAFISLFSKGENIDIITITQHLKDRGLLEEVGGRAYISALTDSAPISSNAEYYAKIIKSKFILRRLITVGNEIVNLGHKQEESADTLIDKAEQLTFNLTQTKVHNNTLVPIGNIVQHTWEELEGREKNKELFSGLDTGYYDLNVITAGLQRNDLIIVAARPSMGKSALALNIGENVALVSKKPVLIFSLEMSKEQVVQRILCSRAQVNNNRIRTGQLYPEDWSRLGATMNELEKAPLFVDDSPGLSLLELRGKCRRFKAENGDLGLIIIDYLQLMEGKSSTTRLEQVSEISRGLKQVARELNVPVIALSQLSRAVEARQDKRPMLSDLRDSGCIEQDADVVIFIYRDEYYNLESEHKGIAEIIIAKQRSGPTGTATLLFQKDITRFKNKILLV